MLNQIAPLVSVKIIPIVSLALTVMVLGLIAGIVIASRQEAEKNPSSLSNPKKIVLISRSLLLRSLIFTIVFLAIGIITLAYGYGNSNALLRGTGYCGVFIAFTFLGGLLHKANI